MATRALRWWWVPSWGASDWRKWAHRLRVQPASLVSFPSHPASHLGGASGVIEFSNSDHYKSLLKEAKHNQGEVLLWPYSSTFLAEHEVCREEFFHCGAVELAKKLLGHYLYCHESEIVVRILETEAYPEDDIAYTKLFRNNAAPELNAKFNLTGGIMVAWQPVHSLRSRTHLYITAGNEDSGDVVYLRSCEPIEGRHIIEERRQMSDETPRNTKKVVLVGPSKLSEGLGNEWEGNPVLYEHGGVQLFHGIVPPTEKVLCGKRHLRSHISEVSDENYRFALETHMPSYQYTNKSTLRPLHQ